MRKALLLLPCIFLLTAWVWPLPSTANPDKMQIPTAPPPPMATDTEPALPPPETTHTPTVPSHDGIVTKTATRTALPAYTKTFTPIVTPTPSVKMAPTLMLTLTPTTFLNLRIVVYLDANKDNLFEFGEGVNDLLLRVNAERWADQAILQDGEAWLALPPDLTPGSDVQVQAPYLHWSVLLRAPKPGEILEATLCLDLPQFPVSLP